VITDNEKLNQLLGKVEEIILVLNNVSQDLKSVSTSLKSIAVGQIIQPANTTSTLQSLTSATSEQRGLDDIRMSFPEELESRLSFEEKNDYIIIKPKQFLGSENFAKIASAVRGMGGEYISAGKDSHFRVPKKKT
jgi:hypothetical protein